VENRRKPVHDRRWGGRGGFRQDEAGVNVGLADGSTLRAAYLVGCDGGRSTVRKADGIEFAGFDPSISFMIAEVAMAEKPPIGLRREGGGIGPVDPQQGAWTSTTTSARDTAHPSCIRHLAPSEPCALRLELTTRPQLPLDELQRRPAQLREAVERELDVVLERSTRHSTSPSSTSPRVFATASNRRGSPAAASSTPTTGPGPRASGTLRL
jgi:2-polyprenyl-6-methoxyphenol hydroxylase-like FAD-dependent oxidoreductase